jgi:hypothetical protein
MQKVLAKIRVSGYTLGMKANNHKQYAIYRGQLVIIEELFDDEAYVSFEDGAEELVLISDLESA